MRALQLFFLIVTLTLLTLSPLKMACADTLTLAADEWCPYNCNPSDPKPGFMIEVAKYVFKKAGHDVSYLTVPWSRAIEDARVGKYSAIVGAYKEDAPDFVFTDLPIAESGNSLFVKKGSSWRYSDFESLNQVSLGVIRGYSYSKELDSYLEQHKADSSRVQIASGDDALENNIRKLLAGRVGVVVEDHAVMEYYLMKLGKLAEIDEVGSLGKGEVYIAFAPGNPKSKEYAKLLSAGIRELKESGKLEQLIKSYSAK